MKRKIKGMTCARTVEKVIGQVPGIARTRVNYLKEAGVIGEAPLKALLAAVEAGGYRAVPLGGRDG